MVLKWLRTVVTKHITDYVKKHNLQNPENKRQILCDDKLNSLLKMQTHLLPISIYKNI